MEKLKKSETFWTVVALVITLLTVPSDNWPVIFKDPRHSPEGFLEFNSTGGNAPRVIVVKNGSVESIQTSTKGAIGFFSRGIADSSPTSPAFDLQERQLIEPKSYALIGPICDECKVEFFKKDLPIDRQELAIWTALEVNEFVLYLILIILGACWLVYLLVDYSTIETRLPKN